MLKKYKKVTDAFKWDGTDESADKLDEWLCDWCDYRVKRLDPPPVMAQQGKVYVPLLIDDQEVGPGDYVIRNMNDYPHVIRQRDFEATYTPE